MSDSQTPAPRRSTPRVPSTTLFNRLVPIAIGVMVVVLLIVIVAVAVVFGAGAGY